MTAPLTDREIAQARANDRIGTDLVLDTGAMRIWHLRLAPGETLPAHRHDRPYFWTVLTDGEGQSRFGDGRIADIAYRAGEASLPDLLRARAAAAQADGASARLNTTLGLAHARLQQALGLLP